MGKVRNINACGFSNVGLRTRKGTNGKGMTIEECRAACRKNSACTGIQYSSKNPNCDLIVKSCDFYKKFKKSSRHEWLAEDRACFDGASAVVDPCKTNNGVCHGKRKCTSTNGRVTCGNCAAGYVNNGATKCKACFSFKVSNINACGFSNEGLRTKKGTNGKGMTIEECRAACRKNSACTGIQYSSKNPNCDLIVKNCDFDKKFKKSSGAEWLVESRTCFDGAVVDTCKTNNGGCDSKRKCTESGSFKRAPKGDGYKCPENNKNRLFKALNKTPKECAALCKKNAQCKYFTTSKESPSKYCIGCKVAPVSKHPGAITYVVSRTGGGVTCGNCPAGYANDRAKGCKGSFTRATKFDGYKCPENHKNRVFKALHKTPKQCAALCEKNAQCKYFSTGSPSQYCIGCKVAPATKHPGATSYVMS